MSPTHRKPRIALMGEFSAGKSTLSNLLLGARPLPEKVTATRLSPVWMSQGTQAPYRIDVDGTEEPISIDALEGISVEETRVIRLFFEADILGACDLIDFPGISDPNMSAEVWQRVLDEVDAVLWCTHATQAWRQSEAAVWETIPQAVREKSVLLVTRFDKLINERDRFRVMARLNKETQGLFAATFPISLTQALDAGDNEEAFEASGGGAFFEHLNKMIDDLNQAVGQTQTPRAAASSTPDVQAAPASETASIDAPDATALEDIAPAEAMSDDSAPRISPRRIQHASGARSDRPARPQTKEQVIDMMRASRPVPKLAAAREPLNNIFGSSPAVAAEDESAAP